MRGEGGVEVGAERDCQSDKGITLENLKADRDSWERRLILAREVIKAAKVHEERTLVNYQRAEQAYTEAYIRASIKENEGSDGL